MKRKIPIATNDSIPSINFLKKAFKKFEKRSEVVDENIIKEFVDIFGLFPILPLNISSKETFQNFKTYRIISEKKLNEWALVKTKLTSFSHPPSDGGRSERFNIKGKPVLYTSHSIHTAIEETKIKETESFYVSTWDITQPVLMSYIFLFYKTHYDDETLNEVSDSIEKKMDRNFRIYSKEKRKALSFFLEKITQLTLAEPFNDITSAIGDYYFYSAGIKIKPPLGLIVYPSVQKKKESYNCAFNPDLIKNGILKCTQIQKLKLTSHSNLGSHFNIEEIGIIENDKVDWKKCAYEFKSVVFFDSTNHPYLTLSPKEIEYGKFTDSETKESITMQQYLANNLMTAISNDLQNLANRKNSSVPKIYSCSIPNELVINNVSCNKVNVAVNYHYY